MSFMKSFISPTVIATLTCSLLASFTTIANAKLFVEKIKIQIPNNEISGNIVKGDTTVENIFCERITVTLIEFIPTKPESDRFSVPREKTLGQPVSATGNNLNEGCSYSLKFSYFPKIGAYEASTFKIRAHTINSIVSEQSVSYPFPNNINVQLFPPPPVPR